VVPRILGTNGEDGSAQISLAEPMMISLVTTISYETPWERLVDLIFSRVSSSSVSKSWNNRERVKKHICVAF